jgi:hypothetical protein
VHYSVPFQVTGSDTSGHAFSEPARTEVITRDGGLMICAPSLFTGSHVRLARGERLASASVVGVVGFRQEETAYGIHFLDTSGPSFWGVQFPPPETEGGVGRTVLECARCTSRQVLELSEVELMMLESVRVVSYECHNCGEETLWQIPVLLADPELVTGSTAYANPPTHRKAPRTRNDRKHIRVAMKRIRAGVKRLGMSDDVVDVLDLSRGGVRFLSFVDYQLKTYLEIAVPYTEGGANIYTPARVVRINSRPQPPELLGEYACQYEKRR